MVPSYLWYSLEKDLKSFVSSLLLCPCCPGHSGERMWHIGLLLWFEDLCDGLQIMLIIASFQLP